MEGVKGWRKSRRGGLFRPRRVEVWRWRLCRDGHETGHRGITSARGRGTVSPLSSDLLGCWRCDVVIVHVGPSSLRRMRHGSSEVLSFHLSSETNEQNKGHVEGTPTSSARQRIWSCVPLAQCTSIRGRNNIKTGVASDVFRDHNSGAVRHWRISLSRAHQRESSAMSGQPSRSVLGSILSLAWSSSRSAQARESSVMGRINAPIDVSITIKVYYAYVSCRVRQRGIGTGAPQTWSMSWQTRMMPNQLCFFFSSLEDGLTRRATWGEVRELRALALEL